MHKLMPLLKLKIKLDITVCKLLKNMKLNNNILQIRYITSNKCKCTLHYKTMHKCNL